MELQVLLFFVLLQFFLSADIIFYNFLELHLTLSQKDFCHKFSFFNRFTQIQMTKKNFKKMFFSVITKKLNWEILTKNLVSFKRWDGVKDKKF